MEKHTAPFSSHMNNCPLYKSSAGYLYGIIIKGPDWCVVSEGKIANRLRVIHSGMPEYQQLTKPADNSYPVSDYRPWSEVGGQELSLRRGFSRCRFMFDLANQFENWLVMLGDVVGPGSVASHLEGQQGMLIDRSAHAPW